MASKADILRLAQDHRANTAQLNALMRNDWNALMRLARQETDKNWARELRRVIPALMDTYGSTAATLSAAHYNAQRELQGELVKRKPVGTAFAARTAQALTSAPEVIKDPRLKSMDWWIHNVLEGRMSREQFSDIAYGTLDRAVIDYDALTVEVNIELDPVARGQMIQVRGDGCDFCKTVSFEGVTKVGGNNSFAWHDHCKCQAVPILYDNGNRVKQSWEDEFAMYYNETINRMDDIRAETSTMKEMKELGVTFDSKKRNLMKHMRAVKKDETFTDTPGEYFSDPMLNVQSRVERMRDD